MRWAAGALVVLTALLVACTSSSGDEEMGGDDAGTVVAGAYRLDDEGRACLVDAFSAEPATADLLLTTEEVDPGEADALADVLRGCMSDEQLAAAVAGLVGDALPPTDTSRVESQAACLEQAVLDLDDPSRRTLAVGLLLLAVPADSELAIARGEVVNGLYTACGVELTPGS